MTSRFGVCFVYLWLITATISSVSADDAKPASDARKPAAIEAQNVPASTPELWDRLRQYQNVRSAKFRGWAPDGSGVLIQTRFGNTAQLHRVYQPGGRREQITFFEEPTDGEFIPHEEHGSLLASLSAGGSENNQIFHLDRSTSDITRMTDGKSRNQLGPIRDDGLFFIVRTSAGDSFQIRSLCRYGDRGMDKGED